MTTKLSPRIDALLMTTRPWLTDGGLETTLVFHEGIDLPAFAAFPLLDNAHGRATLTQYFERYLEIARTQGTGFLLDTPTWRASTAWGAEIGWAAADVDRINMAAVAFARDMADRWADQVPMVVNGVIGPEGDGYVADQALTAEGAARYHRRQIGNFAEAGADMVSAVTMTYAAEAIGIANAATARGLPVVISFTVETDGRLPSGQTVADAIAEVDAATDAAPIYYMINCAHPDHYAAILAGAAWTDRLGGLRSNASRMSHAELDAAEELDDGNPVEFGQLHAAMLAQAPGIKVLGGCCGTDHRHIHAVGETCVGGQSHAA